jgi:predicted metal-dependent hydrolase
VINLHWAVMELGLVLVDYVLVHELAHLRHRDHGKEFWATALRAMPDFPERRERLRHVGPQLWLPEVGRRPMRDT